MQRLMPEGWNCGDECLLNGIYTWAEDHRDQFPAGTESPGVLATREAIEAVSGLDVHYYVMVDLRGLPEDGRRRRAASTSRSSGAPPSAAAPRRISGWIEPGTQHLDGYHALWYARSRQGSTNYERMARQRCVMTAMVDQVDPADRAHPLPEDRRGQLRRGPHRPAAVRARLLRRPGAEDALAEDQERQLRPAAHQAVGLRRRRSSATGRARPSRRRRSPARSRGRPRRRRRRRPRHQQPAARQQPGARQPAAPRTAAGAESGGQAAESDLSSVCSAP